MERNVSVNGGHGSEAGDLSRLFSRDAPQEGPQDDQGPCLYLGDGGQRCSRRALEGGFCAVHRGQQDHLNVDVDDQRPVKTSSRVATPTKVLAASIGIIGILLPYIFDLVREVLRWIHER